MIRHIRITVLLLAAFMCGTALSAAEPVFTPLRDDALAARFSPAILNDESCGTLLGIYYRAARDSEGNTWIAYHPVWPYERNETSGCSPWMSRSLYTGGLSLQRKMFGPGDIEVLVVKLDKALVPVRVEYETADNYNPAAFSVKHKTVVVEKEIRLPLCFRVISWNHLFDPADGESVGKGFRLVSAVPVYFSAADWDWYGMTKEKTGALSKNRAFRVWELPAAEEK